MKFSLVATLSVVSSVSFAKGTDLSGGGSSYEINGKRVLLDFVVNEPASQLGEIPGGPVTTWKSKAPDRLGLGNLSTNEFDSKFQELLKPWEKSSPMMVFLLRHAWEQIDIYFVKHRFQNVPFTGYIPVALKGAIDPKKIQTVAIYDSRLGVLLSKPAFEELGQDSQIGVLIHEAGRHLQKRYGFEFTDESLQLLTNAIVKHSPGPGMSLDSATLLKGPMADYTPSQLLAEMHRSFTEGCQKIVASQLISNREREQYQSQCAEGLSKFDKIQNVSIQTIQTLRGQTAKAWLDRDSVLSRLNNYTSSMSYVVGNWGKAAAANLKRVVEGKTPEEATAILSGMLDYDIIPENTIPVLATEKKSELIETFKPIDRATYFHLVFLLKYLPADMTNEIRRYPSQAIFAADNYMTGARKQVIWYAISSANHDTFLDKSGRMVSDAIEKLEDQGILVAP
jgi:hypothetical protein